MKQTVTGVCAIVLVGAIYLTNWILAVVIQDWRYPHVSLNGLQRFVLQASDFVSNNFHVVGAVVFLICMSVGSSVDKRPTTSNRELPG